MDANDLLYAMAGFVVGATVVAILFEAMARGRSKPGETVKLTAGWRLSELQDPIIVARDLLDVEVPQGARIVSSGLVGAAAFGRGQVRQVPAVPAEFALDAKRGKALLFLGGIESGSLALLSVDPALLARLNAEATGLWERGDPYVERRSIAELAGRSGIVVETQGTVQDVLPYQGRFLLRLEDAGHVVGVQVDKDPADLRSERVLVRGKLVKDRTGYPLLEAFDLRRIS